MTRGRPFLHRQRFWCVLHVLYVNFNHYLVSFFTHVCRVRTETCRAAETEADGNEYFLDVNSWPQRKKSETEERTVSFWWLLSIYQLQNTAHFHPVVFFSPCHVWHNHPGWTFSQLSCGSAYMKSLVHGELLTPPTPTYFLFTVSKFLSVDSHRHIYFLCPCFCGSLPVCGGPL